MFFGVLLGSAGIPIPGQIILIASGVLAQQGYLDLRNALVFGILGAVAGAQIGYWVGHKKGHSVILRWGPYILVTPERLALAERLFRDHGGKTVLFARFMPGLRVFSALLAGISGMNRKNLPLLQRLRWCPLAYNHGPPGRLPHSLPPFKLNPRCKFL